MSLSFFKPPEFDDADDQRRARIIFNFSLVIVVASILPMIHNYLRGNIETALVLAVFPIFCSLSIALVRKRFLEPAALFLSYGILSFSFALVWTGEGIYDISVLTYPASLVVGGLLLSNRSFIIYSLVALASVWVFWHAEMNGWIKTSFNKKVTITALIDVWTILVVTGLGVRFYINDINRVFSRLREEELKVRASEARFRMLIEQSPDLIMLINQSNQVDLVNRDDLKALVGKDLAVWVHPDYETPVKILLNQTVGSLEVPDRNEHWYRLQVKPLPDAPGSRLLIAADITEKRRLIQERASLESQYRQSQKLESLGQLASGIAHDFNNLLSVIITQAEGLERFRTHAEKFGTKTEAILKAADRGAGLVRQILTFARKSDITLKPVQLQKVIGEIGLLLHETFPKTMTLEIQVQDGLPPILADSGQIHQVLMNLCVNARDAMNSAGTLTIAASEVQSSRPGSEINRWIRLSVTDTGTGMTEDIRQRIFEPFFTTKSREKGTGLGLAVVYGIIQTHKGWIDLETAPGAGTTFHVFLPIPADGTITDESAILKLASKVPWSSMVLLLAEHDETLRETSAQLFTEHGATVITAGNGSDALRLYRDRPTGIDLVITSHNLHGITGVDLIGEIRLITPNQKLLLSTGTPDPDVYSRVQDLNVPVLLKPYPAGKLLETVSHLLING